MSVSTACPSAEESSVLVEGDLGAAVALMSVRGVWDQSLRQVTNTALNECLSGHPEAMILDLSALDDRWCGSTTTWTTAQQSAAVLQPIVQLALCIPPEMPLADRMQRLGTRGYLPVYAKLRQARVAIAGRLPCSDRNTLTLQPEPDSPSLARDLVTQACLSWELADLLHPARLVMSELVTNAIEHTGSTITVSVSRRDAGVHLTVSDSDPTLPMMRKPARPRPGRPLDDRGRGLRVVTATADAWGALPTKTGKVVWATLQPAIAPR
ncbi:ATP-binding protein [Actinoplanes sp. NPDC026619]|uniref:ATP-binding protein n=1 Tax=Actinoplanes sp. NPDC026619 TaxID=3155798 RepID=UPI0033DD00A3